MAEEAAAAQAKMAEKMAKRKRVRKRAIEEILSSEKSYVDSLTTVCNLFIFPLKTLAKEPREEILSFEDIATVFSNIEPTVDFGIYTIDGKTPHTYSRAFRAAAYSYFILEKQKTDIGKTFLDFSQFFKMYTMYVNNYDKAVQFLKTQKTPRFEEFLTHALQKVRLLVIVTIMMDECKQPSVESFLIMPIQRIPRYKMLLEEVIKNTEEGHSDLPDLTKATEAIAKVAKHINEEVTRNKNREKILELENLFGGSVALVHPTRVFIRHGPLVKKCRASNRTYEFFLFNNLLVYASASGFGKLKMHRKIEINNSFLVQDLPDKPAKSGKEAPEKNCFQIVSAAKSFVVMAKDPSEKIEWMKAINVQIEALKETIVGRRGSRLGSQFQGGPAPVWESDHSSTECNICSRRFTMLRRRHHCRFCGILVCNSCSLKRLMTTAYAFHALQEGRVSAHEVNDDEKSRLTIKQLRGAATLSQPKSLPESMAASSSSSPLKEQKRTALLPTLPTSMPPPVPNTLPPSIPDNNNNDDDHNSSNNAKSKAPPPPPRRITNNNAKKAPPPPKRKSALQNALRTKDVGVGSSSSTSTSSSSKKVVKAPPVPPPRPPRKSGSKPAPTPPPGEASRRKNQAQEAREEEEEEEEEEEGKDSESALAGRGGEEIASPTNDNTSSKTEDNSTAAAAAAIPSGDKMRHHQSHDLHVEIKRQNSAALIPEEARDEGAKKVEPTAVAAAAGGGGGGGETSSTPATAASSSNASSSSSPGDVDDVDEVKSPTMVKARKRKEKIHKLETLIQSLPQFNVKALRAKAELAQLLAEDQMLLNKKAIYSRRRHGTARIHKTAPTGTYTTMMITTIRWQAEAKGKNR
eukprot:jgi/Bigna1/80538/fgenesh1_pg.72_\